MSLVRHANSPYWYMSFMVNGKTIFKSTKTPNKALAQKIENEERKKAIVNRPGFRRGSEV